MIDEARQLLNAEKETAERNDQLIAEASDRLEGKEWSTRT